MKNHASNSSFASGFSEESLDTVTCGFKDENICGEGASCIVYRMRLNGLLVAVKRLRDEYQTDPTYVASYRKEYQIGQRLKHDALPVYRDFHEDMNEVYIIMDFVDGITLEDFINIPEGVEYFSSSENVKRFVKELLIVVGYLHRCGVVHSDLKPANIMLRHIDRSVMLLDLDKSYCDILDNTHGGTVTMSDPMNIGQKPTVFKDFSAIGKIIYLIEENVPGFHASKFSKFRKACADERTSYNILEAALEQKSSRNLWIVACILTLLVIASFSVGWYIKSNEQQNFSFHGSSMVEKEMPIADSTAIINQKTQAYDISTSMQEESVSKPSSQPQAIVPTETSNKASGLSIDIDTQMSELISKIEHAHKVLTSGISRKELSDLQYDLVQTYLRSYQAIIANTKSHHPDLHSIDVELAVARAYEDSRAYELYSNFNTAVSDTLRKLDDELHNDFK